MDDDLANSAASSSEANVSAASAGGTPRQGPQIVGSDAELAINDAEQQQPGSPEVLVSAGLSPDPPTVGLRDAGDHFQVLGGADADSSPDELDAEDPAPIERFPWKEFHYLQDGLSRISWVVYPYQLNACLLAAVEIEDKNNGSRYAPLKDQTGLRRLLRDAMPNALEKCLEDHNVHRWPDNIQFDIYRCLFALVNLTLARLHSRLELVAVANASAESTPGVEYGQEVLDSEEDDLRELLQYLCVAFDPECEFHRKHRHDLLPEEQPGIHTYNLRWTKHQVVPVAPVVVSPAHSAGSVDGGTTGAAAVGGGDRDDAHTGDGISRGLDEAGPDETFEFEWLTNLLEHFGGHTRNRSRWGFQLFHSVLATLPGATASPAAPAAAAAGPATGAGSLQQGQGQAAAGASKVDKAPPAGTVSLALADSMLHCLEQVTHMLTDAALDPTMKGVKCVLSHIRWAADQDNLEVLSAGQDPLFQTASSTLQRSWAILRSKLPSQAANELVSEVQCALILRLLSHASFNKHLAAVREINRLLTRAQLLIDTDGGVAIEAAVSWLRQHGLVQRLLRANLHQKQYVDQVQKVLKVLCSAGGLQEEHVDLLWTVTEKADTFDVVKNNVFGILGELAMGFTASQLDGLFARLEKCKGWPAADTLRLVELMRRFAKSDQRAIMADRVLRLLWDIVMDCNAPVEVIKCGALQEVVTLYDHASGKSDYASDFSQRCVDVIRRNGCNVLAALHLLKEFVIKLCAAAAEDDVASTVQDVSIKQGGVQHRPDVLARIERQFQLVDLVLTNLEAAIHRQRSHASASTSAAPLPSGALTTDVSLPESGSGGMATGQLEGPQQQQSKALEAPPACSASHATAVRDYLDFLLYLGMSGREFEWPQVSRVWAALAETPACAGDRDQAMLWAMQMHQSGGMSADAAQQLLVEKLTAIDPSQVNMLAWNLFVHFFRDVNQAAGRIVHSAEADSAKLDVLDLERLDGLGFLWSLALNAPSQIATSALQYLALLHNHFGGALADKSPEIRREFLRKCAEGAMVAAVQLGLTPGSAGDEISPGVAGSILTSRDGHVHVMDGVDGPHGAGTGPDAGSPRSGVLGIAGPAAAEAPARHMDRCLLLLMEMIHHQRSSRKMPATPGHAASFQGPSIRVEVVPPNAAGAPTAGAAAGAVQQQQGRLSLVVHRNMYVGLLRRDIATMLTMPPQHLRLLCNGSELGSDAAQVCEYPHFNADGTVIIAMYSPVPNTFSTPPPPAGDAAATSAASGLGTSTQGPTAVPAAAAAAVEASAARDGPSAMDAAPSVPRDAPGDASAVQGDGPHAVVPQAHAAKESGSGGDATPIEVEDSSAVVPEAAGMGPVARPAAAAAAAAAPASDTVSLLVAMDVHELLLLLLQRGPTPNVRSHAALLLDALPTQRRTRDTLLAALLSEPPEAIGRALRTVLYPGDACVPAAAPPATTGVPAADATVPSATPGSPPLASEQQGEAVKPPHPAGLLYNLQALCALMFPVELRNTAVSTAAGAQVPGLLADAEQAALLRRRFVCYHGIKVLLGAVNAATDSIPADARTNVDLEVLRSLHDTTLQLLLKLMDTVRLLEGEQQREQQLTAAAAFLQQRQQQAAAAIAATAAAAGDATADAAVLQAAQQEAAAAAAAAAAAERQLQAARAAPAQLAVAVVGAPLQQVVLQVLPYCAEVALHCSRCWGGSWPAAPTADNGMGGGGQDECVHALQRIFKELVSRTEADEKLAVEAIAALQQAVELCPSLLLQLVGVGTGTVPGPAPAGDSGGSAARARLPQLMREMVLSTLLLSWSNRARAKLTGMLSQLAKASPNVNHWLLCTLGSEIHGADTHPQQCADFYTLLLGALGRISEPAQLAVGQKLLLVLVDGLDGCSPAPVKAATSHAQGSTAAAAAAAAVVVAAAAATPENDSRLEGKLKCIAAACEHMDVHSLLPGNGGIELLEKLLRKFLFPEAAYVRSIQQARAPIDPQQLQVALAAPAATRGARQAALGLVVQLMSANLSALRAGAELLLALHYSGEGPNGWDMAPKTNARAAGGYCGLKNGGATCYMNSVFQQLYMQPAVRRMILAHKEPAGSSAKDRVDSVLYQVQVMFAHLALTCEGSYTPTGFWAAFRDYDGNPVNLREHQDAYEFFTRLQDAVDCGMRSADEAAVMQRVLGGRFAQQIICRGVPFRSQREDEFYAISVDVRGKRGLVESLESYVQGELMEGDNQYYCEEVCRKVDAVKRTCIKALPHTLVVHLKRFEFDYENMNRWKVRDRFEFPLSLDMWPYTVEGLAEQEAKEAADAAGTVAAGPNPPPPSVPTTEGNAAAAGPTKSAMYELRGIVVHSGTAFAGHYYSYIKARSDDPAAQPASAAASMLTGGSAGQWHMFDDHSISPWDARQLEQDCFGGKSSMEVHDGTKSVMQEFDRPNSAYMLVYERLGGGDNLPQEPCSTPEGTGSDPAAPTGGVGSGSAEPTPGSSGGGAEPMAISPLPAAADAAAAAGGSAGEASPMCLVQEAPASGSGAGVGTDVQEPPTGHGQAGASAFGGGGGGVGHGAQSGAVSHAPAAAPAAVGDGDVHMAQADSDLDMASAASGGQQQQAGAGKGMAREAPLPYGMPRSIYEEVMLSNLSAAEERHLLDRDYFAFMRQLVVAAALAYQSSGAKVRRTLGSPTQQQQSTGGGGGVCSQPVASTSAAAAAATVAGESGSGGAGYPQQPGVGTWPLPGLGKSVARVRGEDRDQVAVLLMQLALSFTFRVFIRSASSLRDEQQTSAWAAALEHLMETCPAAYATFLSTLAHGSGCVQGQLPGAGQGTLPGVGLGDASVLGGGTGMGSGAGAQQRCNFWLQQGLMLTPGQDLRQMTQRLLLAAMRLGITGKESHDVLVATWRSLASLLRSNWPPTWQLSELFGLLTELLEGDHTYRGLLLKVLADAAGGVQPGVGMHELIEAAARTNVRYNNGDGTGQEVIGALKLVSVMVRGLDFSPHLLRHNQPGMATGRNPHALPGQLPLADKAAYEAVASPAGSLRLIQICFNDREIIMDSAVLELVHALQWCSGNPSMEVIRAALQEAQETKVFELADVAPYLAASVAGVNDHLTIPRVRMFLTNATSGGLLSMMDTCRNSVRRSIYMRMVLELSGVIPADPSMLLPAHAPLLHEAVCQAIKEHGVESWSAQLTLLAQSAEAHAQKDPGSEAAKNLHQLLVQCEGLLHDWGA